MSTDWADPTFCWSFCW